MLVTVAHSSPKGASGAGGSSRQPEVGTGPPDPSLNGPWAAVVIHFTAIDSDLSKRVVTAITLAPNDTWLAWTLAVLRVTDSGQRACWVAVTQEAGRAARGLVVVLLAVALAACLVAVWIKAFADVTVTWAARGVSPPASGARLVNPSFTVRPKVILGTLAGIAMGGTGLSGTRGVMLTWVQVTYISTVVTIVTRITAAGIAVPVITAIAVGRTWVRVTGVWQAAAWFYIDAFPMAGIQTANTFRHLAYPNTLQTAPEAAGHTTGRPRHSPDCNVAQVQPMQPGAQVALCPLLPIVKGQNGMAGAPTGSQCQLCMVPVAIIGPAWLQPER